MNPGSGKKKLLTLEAGLSVFFRDFKLNNKDHGRKKQIFRRRVAGIQGFNT